jgi:hypothetical protein
MPRRSWGDPRVTDTSIGKAIEFDGIDDALFVDVHPLTGATTFTCEAIFRPDGGNREQRWFHLQEAGSENRMLFEIRVAGNQWFLDSFHFSDRQPGADEPQQSSPAWRLVHVASSTTARCSAIT